MAGRAPRPAGKSTSKAAGTSARGGASGRSSASATSRGRGGSGLRRPRSPQSAPPTKGTAKPERMGRSTNRLVILLLVMGALVISFGSSLRAYLQQSDQIHQLQAQIAASEASIAQSQEQQKRWQDPSYVEQQARLRFGWVMPGQTPYVVLGADGQPLNSSSALDATAPTIKTTPVAWWHKEASSVQAADNPPAPVKKPTPATRIGN